jgi:hypothetical protein
VMLMKEELLAHISKYLGNFTNAQTDSLKKSIETVHDSIQTSVNDILLYLLETNLFFVRIFFYS